MPPRNPRVNYRVGNDYERVKEVGPDGKRHAVPGEFQIAKRWRRRPQGGMQQYTPPNTFYGKADLLEKLSQVRTRTIRLDLVGSLKADARYKPEEYLGFGTIYLSRNIPQDVLYLYERIATTTDMGVRIRDLLNDLTDFDFAVIEEVRFVERGRPQHNPVLANIYASDKKAGRF